MLEMNLNIGGARGGLAQDSEGEDKACFVARLLHWMSQQLQVVSGIYV